MRQSFATFLKDPKTRVILILLLALMVRLIGVATRPIWYDEAFSILFAEKGLGQMLQGTIASTGNESAEEHPLGYYTLLWSWMNTFGSSLISVRFLSVLAGLGIVLLVYLIAKELFDSNTAVSAMVLAAINPFQIHYAQEIRMYVYLAFWLLLATYAFLRGRRIAGWSWWGVFSISSALAQYTHNLAAFFLITLAAIPLLQRDWKNLRSTAIAGGFAILLYSPWLVQLPSQLEKVGRGYWVERPGVTSIFNMILVYTTNTPLPNLWVIPGLISAILIFIVSIIQTIRVRSHDHHPNGLWIAYLSFSMPILLFIFSQWIPVYVERALLPSSAFVCIWFAWVLQNTSLPKPGRRIYSSLITLTFIAGIYQHITYRGFPYGPFREITTYIQENIQHGDVIVHSNKLSMLPSLYFDNSLPQTFIGDLPGSSSDTLAPATQRVLQIEAMPDISTATKDANRVWYIIYQRSIDEYSLAGISTHPDIEYLNSNFNFETEKTWDGVQILLFTRYR